MAFGVYMMFGMLEIVYKYGRVNIEMLTSVCYLWERWKCGMRLNWIDLIFFNDNSDGYD